MRGAVLGMVLAGAAHVGPVLAGDVPVETGKFGGTEVTLHLQPFLTEQELTTLRLVLTNEQALAVFVGAGKGFAAMAVNPDEGFIRDDQPVKSALALAGLESAEAAGAAAVAGCQAAAKAKAPCVVVLEVKEE